MFTYTYTPLILTHTEVFSLSLQSPSRRNSQMVAEETHGDTRGYIASPESSCTHNADYEFDSRNANYLSREDTAPRYTNGTNNFPPTPDNSDNNATNNNPQFPLQWVQSCFAWWLMHP